MPEPLGEIDKSRDVPELDPRPRVVDMILRMLAGADLLDIESVNALGHTTKWLLVPVGHAELEFLATFDAGIEDLEDGADREARDDDDDDTENEPSMGSLNDMRLSQVGWGVNRSALVDAEKDGDDEPGGCGAGAPVTHHASLAEWRKAPAHPSVS